MISSVHGIVEAADSDSVVITVGGIGLRVFVPASTLADLHATVGERARLHTQLVVREDSLSLYGFATAEALRLFALLQEVSGIGPKLALKMLSALSPQALVNAIVQDDTATLLRVPGIGRKTAARLSLELKGALEKEWLVTPGAHAASPVDTDAVAALTTLGYSPAEARSALAKAGAPAKATLEQKIEHALRQMGRR